MTITKKQLEEMLEAAKPLVRWLNENCHPHCAARVDQNTGSGLPISSLSGDTVFWWRPADDSGPYLRSSQVQEIRGHAIAIRDGDRFTSYPQWLDFDRITIVRVDSPNDQDHA